MIVENGRTIIAYIKWQRTEQTNVSACACTRVQHICERGIKRMVDHRCTSVRVNARLKEIARADATNIDK